MPMHVCTYALALTKTRFVVWDTETTGLEDDAAIVSIGIVRSDGQPLLDTLINPGRPIPSQATAIHGVTDDMAASAPAFAQLHPAIYQALHNQPWIIYNAAYDIPRLAYECQRAGLPEPTPSTVWCAMELYSEYVGDWNDYRGSYRWQRLSSAASRFGISHQAHHALGDALTTLQVIRSMAAQPEADEAAAIEFLHKENRLA